MNKNKKLDVIITDAVKKMTELCDVNTIVGKPILTDGGSTIIPISKMTVGFLSGGGEYGEVKIFQSKNGYPHSGASGGLVSVKPSGFLIEKKGVVKFVHCPSDMFEKAFDTAEELFRNINEKN